LKNLTNTYDIVVFLAILIKDRREYKSFQNDPKGSEWIMKQYQDKKDKIEDYIKERIKKSSIQMRRLLMKDELEHLYTPVNDIENGIRGIVYETEDWIAAINIKPFLKILLFLMAWITSGRLIIVNLRSKITQIVF
jgi:hypothetical protein